MYSGKGGCIPAKWLYSGKMLFSCKVVVFGKSDCNRVKLVVIKQNGCIRANFVVFEKNGCVRTKVVVLE